MTQREARETGGLSQDQAIEVEVTCPDVAIARHLARAVLEAGLVACANILPGVESFYHWQGRIESDGEVLLRLKARLGAFDALAALITRLHPYDLPAIVALPVIASGPGYETWLRDSTTGGRGV